MRFSWNGPYIYSVSGLERNFSWNLTYNKRDFSLKNNHPSNPTTKI